MRSAKKSDQFEVQNFWLEDLYCPLNPANQGFASQDVESVYECEKSGWLNVAESSSCRTVGGFTCFDKGMTGNFVFWSTLCLCLRFRICVIYQGADK